jgi:peptide/nickel transport system substrate-binding protein
MKGSSVLGTITTKGGRLKRPKCVLKFDLLWGGKNMLVNSHARNRRRNVLLAGLLATLLSQYFVLAQQVPAAAATGTLNIITAEPTTGFDPAIAKTQASLRVMELIYDTLVDYDSAGKIVPDLAESWTTSKDGLTLTFNLRNNAKFSDGSAITAADVVFSLQRAAASATMKAAYAVMKSVVVKGVNVVTVKLSAKSRTFFDTIATIGNSAILSKKEVSANPNYFTLPTATSGPWTLASNIPQNRAEFQANTSYWKTGYPKIKTINYVYSSDGTAKASALESGSQDMTFPMAPIDAIRLQKAGKIRYYLAAGPTMLFWGFNKNIAPFDDVRVRQAIAYVVPRQEKQDICWEGIGPVSYGNVIFSGPMKSRVLTTYKVSKSAGLLQANRLLNAAGWIMSSGGIRVAKNVKGVTDGTRLSFKVPFEASWQQARCNTEMMSQFVKAAGIQALPQAFDGPTFWTEVGKGSFGMYHGGNGYPTVDAQMQSAFTCNGGSVGIMAKWCNPTFDALVAKAIAAPVAQATRYYHAAEEIINKEVPLIMVGGQYNVIGVDNRVTGYYGRFDSSNRALITAEVSN